MNALSKVLRALEGARVAFWCPGCDEAHHITVGPAHNPGVNWGYDGNAERPTFTPSILVRSGHYVPGHEDQCWCKFNAELVAKGEEPSGFECSVCHSFVTSGRIQFLSDCTHALAGQTVDLPEFPT
jgi:hypothetical protein